ncbi:hypothetical protein NEPAR06_0010 [Nematocida parisii]|uniref:Uncharacterized protein n=1 Tax=Nematocida parisii (strain ERTm3) TaxID=935791 RepID=I3EE48_NEMP3|nr:uncharacterized protein NEPG_00097 [Nematocida parisii ERTm1]EIJ87495.1 hypothetical protein NEQG_02376 [Nematocida parisii ERTm3]KAI5127042.1 hypothetical protein NEPAR08_0714 [Nematocida parisii]EIJ94575.1 hypothetical protein NEPG_00097 [Nematocida parisii ERTm1]KAI5142705.1 hypothetical protein NEPAR07_0231 [Nematocida parisii]KAI5152889.1 hypothetical protein NEPAR06_0010 [Nematocida parisii]|eukprot:XP_013057931.1 hypothetical protein NEPG_00097 [Nematocida parisii ERTm1]
MNSNTSEKIVNKSFIPEDNAVENINSVEKTYSVPRYIYKEGHSRYVTRDISINEILFVE